MSEPLPRRRAAAVAYLAAAALYFASPVREITDSNYTVLAAQRLATSASLDLAPAFVGEIDPRTGAGESDAPLPYQLRRVGDRVLYDFPLGAVLVAAPWIAVAEAVGGGVIDENGRHLPARERAHQSVLAALFTAAFVAVVFVAADRRLPRRWAWALAAAVAFATPLWSTASRGLWSHTACLAALALVLAWLAGTKRESATGAFGLGLLVAFAYVARPTAAIAAALVGIELVRRGGRLRTVLAFALGAAAILGPFAALSLAAWGEALPPYYLHAGLGPPRLDALAGALVSPNRGLFVFEPALALALVYAGSRWRDVRRQRLVVLGAAGLAAHAIVVARFGHWWGGHAYGPRLFTEAVFYEVLLGLGVAASLAARSETTRGWRRAFGVALVVGVAIHAGGALSRQGLLWNSRPTEVDAAPERVWQWRDWQPLAWANRAPRRHRIEPPPRLDEPSESEQNRPNERRGARDARRQRRRAQSSDRGSEAPD